MKKIYGKLGLILASAACTAALCSCGNGGLFAEPTPTPIPQVDPAQILSEADISEAIGNSYAVRLEGGASARSGNEATASYYADPLGNGDPVIVSVKQFTDTVSKDDIWNNYDGERIKRSSSELIEGIGEDAYIAFPSIHVYDRGCEIIVTAGSGSDEGQENLLKTLAEKATANFETIMPE